MEKNKKNLIYLLVPTIILVLLITFIYQNTLPVEVNFLWFSGKTRVIYLMLICILLGVLASKSVSYYRRLMNKKSNKIIDVQIEDGEKK